MEEGKFMGMGQGVYEAKDGLSKQERILLNKEMERNALLGVTKRVEALRQTEGPKLLVDKYPDELYELINEYGSANNITLGQCSEFAKGNGLKNFEPIVILAAALEAEAQKKSTIQ